MQYATYNYVCVNIHGYGINFSHYNNDVSGGGAECNPHNWHKIDCLKSVQLLYNPELPIIIYI